MNSSEQLVTEPARQSVPAQLISNWIEIFAVPIASAIMEAQPILLLLHLIVPKMGTGDLSPEDALKAVPDLLSLVLLMVGLQWWCMYLHYAAQQRGQKERQTMVASIIGAFVAVSLIAVTHINQLNSTFIVILLLLTGWFLYRGILRARDSLGDDYLTNAFRIGFFALLAVMVFAVLSSISGTDLTLITELARDLPIFFLSGMIALSFTRIGAIKKEQARHPGSSSKESTRSWLAGLTLTWVVLVLASIALESLPLDLLVTILNPLWIGLGFLATGLLFIVSFAATAFLFILGLAAAGFIYLIGLVFHIPQSRNANVQQQVTKIAQPLQHASNNTKTITTILVIVLLIVLAIVATTVIQKSRKKNSASTDDEEEVREALDRNAIMKQRREERKKQQREAVALEALDPASVRARYRDFLQSLAAKGGELERQPNETPLEYQRRLLSVAKKRRLLTENDEAADPAILHELTQAYAQERYGGKPIDNTKQNYLRSWVPKLVQKLTSASAAPKPAAQWSAERSRWGED